MKSGWKKLREAATALSLLCTSAAGADTIADFSAVPPADVVSIQVSPTPSLLQVGDTFQLSVTATFADGSERDVTSDRDTSYTSDSETPEPESFASISDEGLIEALTVGSLILRVSHIQASGAMAFQDLTFEIRVPGDGDGDGLPDAWESANGLDPAFAGDAVADTDGDGLINSAEFDNGTDPRLLDTDGDRRSDGLEVVEGTDPLVPDGPLVVTSPDLDETCVVAALNRTAPVDAEGIWVLPNVPANIGQVRIRATCVKDGITRFGQSEFIEVPSEGIIKVAEILFDAPQPIPATLTLSAPQTVLTGAGQTVQINVTATYSDDSQADLSAASTGTDYGLSNPAVATIDDGGLLTAQASGTVLVRATNEGAIGLLILQVTLSGDTDGDGLADDFELANGLDPNDPADALADPDGDGLSNLDEFLGGLDLLDPDTDDDGLLDGEEGSFGTNPLVFDTDGDGLSDGLEVMTASDPLDPASFNLAAALESMAVVPETFVLTFNTLLGETSTQLAVIGTLIDGNSIDLTERGTNYASSDLTLCNFGVDPGRVFAGLAGVCTITASNSGFSADAVGTVQGFTPSALGFVSIPGFAHNVDVAGDLAYVAAGGAGLQVVDVSDRAAPQIAATLDTPGDAQDVKLVGDLAYVADGGSGLAVVDISNPLSPTTLGTVAIPGGARDIASAGDFAYVAAGAAGFHVVDVRDGAAPVVLATVDTPGSAGGLALDAAAARLLVADGGSGLAIYDVSVVSSPQLLGQITTGDARDVVARGDTAFVASGSTGFVAVDVSNPASPVLGAPVPPATGGLLNDVAISGNFAFGADFFFVNGVPILDVSNPATPLPRAILDFAAFRDDDGTGIAVDNLHVYLTAQDGGDSRLYIGQYLLAEDVAGTPPTVTIRSPEDDQNVESGSTVDFRVDAQDDVAVAVVRFLVDGVEVFADTTAPYELALPLPSATTDLVLGAVAEDLAGNSATAPSITVHVLPDFSPPVIESSTPAPGAIFASGETVTTTAVVSDNRGVASVEFRFDGRSVEGAAPYEASFLAPLVSSPETREIEIEAVDLFDNRASTTIPVTIEPLDDPVAPTVTITAPGTGAAVPAGGAITIRYSLADEHSIESYRLEVDGQVIDSGAFVGAAALDRVTSFTAPAAAQPGDRFTVHAEVRDFGGNVTVDEITLVVPEGTVLSGNQTLDSSFDGQSLILDAGTHTVVEPVALENLTVLDGARVIGETGETLSLTVTGVMNVSLNGSIDVSSQGFAGGGGSHPEGFAPDFVTPSTTDAGGSHGGAGIEWNGGGTAGEVYDSVYSPHLAGGGGSEDNQGADGTRGGGVLEIEAGELVLDGTLLANAQPSGFNSGRPAGAGGSVLVRTSFLSGSGSIQASGTSTAQNLCCGNNTPGSGGGGRVAVYADVLERFDPVSQMLARGGTRGRLPAPYASPGTVYVSDATSIYGDLFIDNGEDSEGDRRARPTVLPTLGEHTVTAFEVAGPDAWVTSESALLPRWLGAWMTLRDAAGDSLGTYPVLELDGNARALLEGAGAVTGAASLAGEYRFDQIRLLNGSGLQTSDPIEGGAVEISGDVRLPAEMSADDVTVRTGSVASVANGQVMRLMARGTVTIEAGGWLDVSAQGYAGGNASHPNGFGPDFVVTSSPDAGGSHGGVGRVWNGGGAAGEVYDSVYVPQLAGGGGSEDNQGAVGTRGGGVIDLDVAELVLDGEIRANAETSGFNSGRPTGAGGSVLIRAGQMSGTGLIQASGTGTATNLCCGNNTPGSGGGGRVAIYTDSLVGFDPVTQIRARGGARGRLPAPYAAPGTIYVSDGTSTYGSLLIDNGEDSGADRRGPVTDLPTLGTQAVTAFDIAGADAWVSGDGAFLPRWLGAWMKLYDGAGGSLGIYRVLELDGNARARLDGAGAASGAATLAGVYRFDAIQLLNGSGLGTSDPIEGGDIETTGSARLPAELSAADLTVRSGSVVSVATGQVMRLVASGTLTIEAGARLDVSAQGYAGGTASHPNGFGPDFVATSSTDAGGSHGGVGRVWNGGGGAGEVYDSVYVPQLAGAGGSEDNQGADGTRGGGVIDLDVAELVLDGEIRANSETSGFNSGRPTGAGGSILIRTGLMSGSGLIQASGTGTATNLCCGNNTPGSGGGGRVAIYADSLAGFDPVAQVRAYGGTRGRLPAPYAAPGTVFVWQSTSTHGRLIVDNGTDSSGLRIGPATELPALGNGNVASLEAEGADAWLAGDEAFLPRWLGAWMVLSDDLAVELGTFRVLMIDETGRALLEGAAGVAAATALSGEYRFDQIDQRNGSTYTASDPVIVP